MKTQDLTKEEHEHIKNGGRVFIVEEISGPRWRILSISEKGVSKLCSPIGEEGYSELEAAKNLAHGFAALSEDSPMVRVFDKT